jgi:PIN domain nuclease of toxin-antitoxin system
VVEELVLDASALIAHLQHEPGHEKVRAVLARGAVISSMNLSEVLDVLSRAGGEPGDFADEMDRSNVLHGALLVEEFTFDDSVEAARLRPLTSHLGLSLADRACLALALRMDFPVITADRAWSDLDIGVEVRPIR